MRIACRITVGALLLSMAIADGRGSVRYRGSESETRLIGVEMDNRGIGNERKESLKHLESLQIGRNSGMDLFNRSFLRMKEIRPPRHTDRRFAKPRRSSKNYKIHHRRSLDDDLDSSYHSLSNISQRNAQLPKLLQDADIYLEPVFHQAPSKGWLLDWMKGWLPDSSNRLGPLIGPIVVPGLGQKVYIRQVDPLQEESSHVLIHVVTREPKPEPVVIQVGASVPFDQHRIISAESPLHEKRIAYRAKPPPSVRSSPPVDWHPEDKEQRSPGKPEEGLPRPEINHSQHHVDVPLNEPDISPVHLANHQQGLFQTRQHDYAEAHTVVNNLHHQDVQEDIHSALKTTGSQDAVADQFHKPAGINEPLSVASIPLQSVDKYPDLPLYPPIGNDPKNQIAANLQQDNMEDRGPVVFNNNVNSNDHYDHLVPRILYAKDHQIHYDSNPFSQNVESKEFQPNFIEVPAPDLKDYNQPEEQGYASKGEGIGEIYSDSHVSNTNQYESVIKTLDSGGWRDKNDAKSTNKFIEDSKKIPTSPVNKLIDDVKKIPDTNVSKNIVVVTPSYPWFYKTRTTTKQTDYEVTKPVFETSDDYEDFVDGKIPPDDYETSIGTESYEAQKNVSGSTTRLLPIPESSGPDDYESRKLKKTTARET